MLQSPWFNSYKVTNTAHKEQRRLFDAAITNKLGPGIFTADFLTEAVTHEYEYSNDEEEGTIDAFVSTLPKKWSPYQR